MDSRNPEHSSGLCTPHSRDDRTCRTNEMESASERGKCTPLNTTSANSSSHDRSDNTEDTGSNSTCSSSSEASVQAPTRKVLPLRSTRGRRLAQLIRRELEKDNLDANTVPCHLQAEEEDPFWADILGDDAQQPKKSSTTSSASSQSATTSDDESEAFTSSDVSSARDELDSDFDLPEMSGKIGAEANSSETDSEKDAHTVHEPNGTKQKLSRRNEILQRLAEQRRQRRTRLLRTQKNGPKNTVASEDTECVQARPENTEDSTLDASTTEPALKRSRRFQTLAASAALARNIQEQTKRTRRAHKSRMHRMGQKSTWTLQDRLNYAWNTVRQQNLQYLIDMAQQSARDMEEENDPVRVGRGRNAADQKSSRCRPMKRARQDAAPSVPEATAVCTLSQSLRWIEKYDTTTLYIFSPHDKVLKCPEHELPYILRKHTQGLRGKTECWGDTTTNKSLNVQTLENKKRMK